MVLPYQNSAKVLGMEQPSGQSLQVFNRPCVAGAALQPPLFRYQVPDHGLCVNPIKAVVDGGHLEGGQVVEVRVVALNG